MKKYNIMNEQIHTRLIKGITKEETDDIEFNKWKAELQKELPLFWEAMEEPIQTRCKFSHSS